MENYNKILAGSLSGLFEVLFTHPLDYLKTRKQDFVQKKIKGSFYKHLINDNNLNIYRGILPRIYGVIPMRMSFWFSQDYTNCILKKNYSNLNKYQKGVIIGITGGFFQTIIDNPIENIKIRQITNQKIKVKDILLKNYGFKETLIRNVGFSISMGIICFQNKSNDLLYNFSISSIAGFIGSIITQPIDFIKTRNQSLQTNTSIYNILLKYYKKGNFLQLYTGGMNRCLLSFFSMGIGFTIYDKFYKLLCNA